MNISVANEIADICVKSLRNGGTIYFIGNGGSAADAQHLAAELVGKLNFDRPPLAALALTTDTSILTAIGNDYGFSHVFSRQVIALGKEGDVLIGMSTSGNSENILTALTAARLKKMVLIGKTGKSGGKMRDWNCDFTYYSPFDSTQEIQEDHMKLGHTYCGLIEKKIFG
jgi:D-sedoheptulose 7-phosphate isomerase